MHQCKNENAYKYRGKCQVQHILLCIIGIVMFTLFLMLFYYQAVKHNDMYSSDLPSHIKFALEKRGYSLLYFFIGIIYKITGGVWGIAIFESCIIILTWLLSGSLISRIVGKISFPTGCFLGIPVIFLTGIYIPGIYEYFYSNQLVAQPWHNITYFGMRLFAVAVMLIFLRMLDTYTIKIDWKCWLLLTFCLLLSTAVKPSFLLGFSSTLFLFLCFDALKAKFEKNILRRIIWLGCSVVPSLLVLWFQSRVLYGSGIEEGGTGIVLVWGTNFVKAGFGYTILKVVCSLALPILVLIRNRKSLKRIDCFVYIMFFVQLAVVILFSESGKRRFDGNFYWGLYCGAYILYLFVHAKFWKEIIIEPGKNIVYKSVGIVLIISQFISGICYFFIVLSGRNFLV